MLVILVLKALRGAGTRVGEPQNKQNLQLNTSLIHSPLNIPIGILALVIMSAKLEMGDATPQLLTPLIPILTVLMFGSSSYQYDTNLAHKGYVGHLLDGQ